MSKFYETKKFKKLHADWNKKLKKSGFEGETEEIETETLVRPQEFNTQRRDAHFGTDYYQFCQQILREYRFFAEEVYASIEQFKAEGQTEEQVDAWLRDNCVHDYTSFLVFQLHSEGTTERQIQQHLVDIDWPKKISQQRINKILHEIKENFMRMRE